MSRSFAALMMLLLAVECSCQGDIFDQVNPGKEEILGTIAIVTKAAGIYAQKSSESRRNFPAPKGMQIVVQRIEDFW